MSGVEWKMTMILLYMSDGLHQLRRLGLLFAKDVV